MLKPKQTFVFVRSSETITSFGITDEYNYKKENINYYLKLYFSINSIYLIIICHKKNTIKNIKINFLFNASCLK